MLRMESFKHHITESLRKCNLSNPPSVEDIPPNTKHLIYNLYDRYKRSFNSGQIGKNRAVERVICITEMDRALIQRIIEEHELKLKRTTNWAGGVTDKTAKIIKDRVKYICLSKNRQITIRKLRAELINENVFSGSTTSLYSLLHQMGFFYSKVSHGWRYSSNKKSTDEKVNCNPETNFKSSVRNMMEVKHSPAGQLEFRNTRNGLPEEDDDLNTLFVNDVQKDLTPSSDECDSKVGPINGIRKHSEDIDDMEVELLKMDCAEKVAESEDSENKKENEETEENKEGMDIFDLALDDEPELKAENGEITDASKVRDTGDDLDTLLSKINDLVEDCIEPEPFKTDEKKPKAIPNETLMEKVNMVIDEDLDDIVCLDSPLPEAAKDDDFIIEEALRKVLDTTETETDNYTEYKEKKIAPRAEEEPPKEFEKAPVSEKESELVKTKLFTDDDDIFVIEDDDEEEHVTKADLPKVEEKVVEEPKTPESKKIDEFVEPADEKQNQIPEVANETKANYDDDDDDNDDDDDDDDIVCLDDSFEEAELTGETKKVETEEATQEEDLTAKDSQKPDENSQITPDKQEETSSEAVDKTPIAEEEPPKEKVEEIKAVKEQEKEKENLNSNSQLSSKEEQKTNSEPSKLTNVINDDEIVILDDDDDETEATICSAVAKDVEKSSTTDADQTPSISAVEKPTSSDNATTVKSSNILSDNSDNARDGVEEKTEQTEIQTETETVQEKAPIISESNSCSNSSNLLKETVNETVEEQTEQPPAKRLRLSQDDANSRHSTVSQEDTKSNIVDDDEVMEVKDEENKSLKRVHSTDSVSSDFKKPKTEENILKSEEVTSLPIEEKAEVKPLPLYPPPKLEGPMIDLSLDFLRRFKKSIHKMTKSDLEELVLQKIVEAIVHKSEFSEMRDLIEKQEKIISGHRTKISELNKQFRDLEMVHNRVLKDLETKNSQFIMPVKITRAVGLQVFFPNKKYDQPLVPPVTPTAQTTQTPLSRSMSNLNNSTPDSSSFLNSPAASSNAANACNITKTNQTKMVNKSQQQQTPVQRRGCVQKLTPLRPDTPRNSPLNRSVSSSVPSSVVSSSTPLPSVPKESPNNVKILNRGLVAKNLINTPPQQTNANVVSSTPLGVTQSSVATNTGYMDRQKTATVPLSLRDPSKMKLITKSYQSDPQRVSKPLPPSATIVTPQFPPTVTAIPKPPNKSVIDLTDEDEVPAAATNNQRPPAEVATSPAPPSPSPMGIANQPGNRPYKVSVVPQQQLQQQNKPNPPKQTPQRPPVAIAPKPNGVAISVRQVPVNQTRYRHPAPLPNQPVQSSNPAWKLPPARPTIRISNLDSGIVISWTIEETSKDKYAESTSYQIYAYQETSGPPLVESWRHVGDVKAMLLPMAVTLTQFQEGQRYYFAVRAVDAHNRCGPFSFAKTWS